MVNTERASTIKAQRASFFHPKPENFEISERLVLQGKYTDGVFNCDVIQTKCPSKYKEDMAAQQKALESGVESKE